MLILKFLSLMKGQYTAALLGLLVSLVASLSSISLMATSGWFISAMGVAGFLAISLDIFTPSALIRLFSIMRTAFRYFDRLISHDATFKIIEIFRVKLFQKSLNLSYEESSLYKNSDIERRMRADIEKLEFAYIKEFLPFTCAFFTSLIVGIFVCTYSFKLAFIILLCVALSGVFIPIFLSAFAKEDALFINTKAKELNDISSDFIEGLFDLMAMGKEEELKARTLLISDELAKARRKLVLFEGINTAILTVFTNLTCLLVILFGYKYVLNKDMEGPDLVMLAIIGIAIFEVVTPLAASAINYQNVKQSALRVFEILEREDVRQDATHKVEHIKSIKLENLSYSYNDKELLKDINLTFDSDKNYVIKGRSGRGKTTLMLLISSLIKPKNGKILVDGIDLNNIDLASYRNRISMSFQDNALFSCSLLDTFRMVKNDVTEEEIYKALDIVELSDFVRSLPNQLNEWIGVTGMSLSGGQARRLATARSLVLDRDFYILDEIAEGLDVNQEQRIIEKIMNYKKGIIIITHKKAGLDLCDKLIEL